MPRTDLMYLIFFFLLTSLVSCSEQKKLSEQEKSIIEIYKLIDSNESIKAIGYAESLIEENKNDEAYVYSLYIAQSSAYAKLAGFSFKRMSNVTGAIIELINSYKSLSDGKEKLAKLEEEKAKVLEDTKILEDEQKRNQISDRLKKVKSELFSFNVDIYSSYIKILMGIPTIADKDIVFLNQAILVLDQYGEKILPEDAVFRALLKALKARTVFVDQVVIAPSGKSCSIGMMSINNTLLGSQESLDAILQDIALAQPNIEQDIKKIRVQIRNTQESLLVSNATVSFLEDLLKSTFKVSGLSINELVQFDCNFN